MLGIWNRSLDLLPFGSLLLLRTRFACEALLHYASDAIQYTQSVACVTTAKQELHETAICNPWNPQKKSGWNDLLPALGTPPKSPPWKAAYRCIQQQPACWTHPNLWLIVSLHVSTIYLAKSSPDKKKHSQLCSRGLWVASAGGAAYMIMPMIPWCPCKPLKLMLSGFFALYQRFS